MYLLPDKCLLLSRLSAKARTAKPEHDSKIHMFQIPPLTRKEITGVLQKLGRRKKNKKKQTTNFCEAVGLGSEDHRVDGRDHSSCGVRLAGFLSLFSGNAVAESCGVFTNFVCDATGSTEAVTDDADGVHVRLRPATGVE